jgi:hypothetical protein
MKSKKAPISTTSTHRFQHGVDESAFLPKPDDDRTVVDVIKFVQL